MSTKPNKAAAADKNTVSVLSKFAALASCLGDPPLVEGEDKAAYDTLNMQIESAVDPQDPIEYLWVRDVIDLTWEIQRLRRLKVSYLAASAPQGLDKFLQKISYNYVQRNQLVSGWTYREDEQVTEVNEILEACKLPPDTIMAETFALKIDYIEKVDRMIASAETRRLNIIREVDRHREVLAQQLRSAANIKDAEYSVIDEGVSEAAE